MSRNTPSSSKEPTVPDMSHLTLSSLHESPYYSTDHPFMLSVIFEDFMVDTSSAAYRVGHASPNLSVNVPRLSHKLLMLEFASSLPAAESLDDAITAFSRVLTFHDSVAESPDYMTAIKLMEQAVHDGKEIVEAVRGRIDTQYPRDKGDIAEWLKSCEQDAERLTKGLDKLKKKLSDKCGKEPVGDEEYEVAMDKSDLFMGFPAGTWKKEKEVMALHKENNLDKLSAEERKWLDEEQKQWDGFHKRQHEEYVQFTVASETRARERHEK